MQSLMTYRQKQSPNLLIATLHGGHKALMIVSTSGIDHHHIMAGYHLVDTHT